MDYNFLFHHSLIGLEFYNPEEYRETGVFYIIIDMDINYIDIEWFDTEDGEYEHSSLNIENFINDLNTGFYVLKQELDTSVDEFWD